MPSQSSEPLDQKARTAVVRAFPDAIMAETYKAIDKLSLWINEENYPVGAVAGAAL
jgi:hypothetical protein